MGCQSYPYREARHGRTYRLLAWLLLAVGAWGWSLAARSAEVVTCTNADAHGLAFGTCGGSEFWAMKDAAEVADGDLVSWCSEAEFTGAGSCPSYSSWEFASEISDEELIYVGYPGEGTYQAAGGVEGFGDGSGDEEPDDPEAEVIDFARSGTAFGAAFVICGLFWGLGKGIGVIVELVRARG